MSLGESSLLIGNVASVSLPFFQAERRNDICHQRGVIAGLTSTQPQSVPVINNVGAGFTTLQPISFQQQLHASPQQPIPQHLQGHMGSSPFMTTMAPLPCHSKASGNIVTPLFFFVFKFSLNLQLKSL